MSNLSNYQTENQYESQIVGELSSGTTAPFSLEVEDAPGLTLDAGQSVYFTMDPGTSKEESIRVSAISGTTLTVAARGLPKYNGGSATTTAHSGGAKIIISNNWQVYDDIATAVNSKQNLDADNAITAGTTTRTSTTVCADVIQNVTTTQRDALTGVANGAMVYNTTDGIMQQRVGGAWVNVDTGTGYVDASTTVAGKVETATDAEFNANTDTGGTGANLHVLPSQVPATKTELAQLSGTTNIAEANTFFGATDITGAEAETLTDGSDAGAKHYHAIKIGSDNWAVTGNAQTETVAHGLGRVPKLLTVWWGGENAFTDLGDAVSGMFMYDGSTTAVCQNIGSGAGQGQWETGAIGGPRVMTDGTVAYTFSVTTMDATNFVFTSANYAASKQIAYSWRVE